MAYVIIGGLLTVLELYRQALHRTHTFAVPVLRIGIPLLFVLAGFWRRERPEWPAITLSALCFAFVLNRDLLPGDAIRVALVLVSTTSLVWVGFKLHRRGTDTRLRELWLAVVATISAFAFAR